MMSFIERVEQNCRLHPERDAVCEGNRRLNYGELWIYSASVYAYLHRKHIGPGDVVMLHLGNTTDTIIACIGVLRAGAAFVIAGRDQAPQAAHYMVDDCGCKAWIDDENFRQILNGKGKNGLETVGEHALAYVIYTSGSTRKPKGVMIERGALTLCAPSIAWKGKPILRTDDRLALLSPLTFAAGMILVGLEAETRRVLRGGLVHSGDLCRRLSDGARR